MKNKKLTLTYRTLDQDLTEFSNLYGKMEYGSLFGRDDLTESRLFIPNSKERLQAESKLSSLKDRLENLPSPDAIFSLHKSHFSDYLEMLKNDLADSYEKPSIHLRSLLWQFEYYMRKDSRPETLKAKVMLEKLNHTPAMFIAIDSWLDTVSPLNLLDAREACQENYLAFSRYAKDIDKYFFELSGEKTSLLQQALAKFSEQNLILKSNLEDRLKVVNFPGETDENSTLVMDSQAYSDYLLSQHGVLLEELLDWHVEEIEKTRDNVFTIMSNLKIPEANGPKTMRNVNEILRKYAGPEASPTEMLCLGKDYIRRTKAASKAYVFLPDEDCIVTEISEVIKDSFPWGGYDSGCTRRRPFTGQMFLNNYNHQAVTNGWIKMNTVHEAYPGHHVQFVRNIVDPIPESLKRGARHTPLYEGTPHRSEKLFEFVFPEDPFYPLFVAYRRHHTAVRIKADLMLRYFGSPIKNIVKLYCEELDFSKETARGQIRAQEYMLGYFTCYYYGFKLLDQWEREFNFGEKEYTELLFSAGRMSMSNFKSFLKLTDADRKIFLNDFASLQQFGENY